MNALALHMGTRQSSQIRFNRFLLCEVDPMGQQHRRSYGVNSTGDVAQSIRDRVDQVGFSPDSITGGLFSGSLSNYISPGPVAQSVSIPNGWNTARFFFFLDVEIQSELNTRHEIIHGYSDQADVSVGGMLDPNTVFYIDGVTTLRNVPTTVGGNRFIAQNITDTNQVLSNHEFGTQTSMFGANEVPVMMRPQDVYANIMKQERGYSMADAFDTRTALTRPKLSRRGNGLQSEFLAKVVGGCMLAAADRGAYGGDSQIYSDALGKVSEQQLTDIDFMGWIQQRNMDTLSNSFTLRMLTDADPGLVHETGPMARMKVQLRERAMTKVIEMPFGASYGNYSNESNSFEDRGYGAIAATMICNSLPELLLRHGLSDVMFRISNVNSTNPMQQVMFAYERAPASLTNPMLPNALPSFQHQVVNDLFNAISNNNMLSYEIRVMCSVFGRTEIELQIENERSRYVSPTFASGLFAPVISSEHKHLDEMGSSFKYLLDDVLQVSSASNFSEELSAIQENGFQTYI